MPIFRQGLCIGQAEEQFLDPAERKLRRGVQPLIKRRVEGDIPGGEHRGLGTHNRVIPLGGGQYLELMAVMDDATWALPSEWTRPEK